MLRHRNQALLHLDPVTKPPKWQNSLHDASPYLTIGISLAGAVLFYVGLGYLVDKWMDTSPTFLLVGGGLGIITFFIQLYRVATEMAALDKKKKADQKERGSSESI